MITTTNGSGEIAFVANDTTAESITYTATDTTDNVTVTQTATVTFLAGVPQVSQSSVQANPTSVPADGTSASTVTVTLAGPQPEPGSRHHGRIDCVERLVGDRAGLGSRDQLGGPGDLQGHRHDLGGCPLPGHRHHRRSAAGGRGSPGHLRHAPADGAGHRRFRHRRQQHDGAGRRPLQRDRRGDTSTTTTGCRWPARRSAWSPRRSTRSCLPPRRSPTRPARPPSR